MNYLFCFLFFCFGGEANSVIIEVAAGAYDRTASPIIFDLPEKLESNNHFRLKNQQTSSEVPIQRFGEGKLVFILDEPLKAGTKRKYLLEAIEKTGSSEFDLTTKVEEGVLDLKIEDQSVLNYILETQLPEGSADYYKRSGFIYPLKTPKGLNLLDGFPVGHTHQHGLFFAWVNTTFRGEKIDFWNQQNKTGTVEHQDLESNFSGAVAAGFKVKLQHISLEFGAVLEEDWEIVVFDDGTNYILDLRSTHRNITTDTLFINQYRYGGLGIRGNRAWNIVDSLHYFSDLEFQTDAGLDRKAANHSKPDWIMMHGKIKEGHPGLLALSDAKNFNSPQTVRVHPEMPYFCYAPMVDSAFFIAPGQNFVSKYRLVLFDYSENSLNSTSYSRDYHYPPIVKIW